MPEIAPLDYITEDSRHHWLPIPIKRKALHELCVLQENKIWRADEIKFNTDKYDFNNKLDSAGQHFIKTTLGLFAEFDSIVMDNVYNFQNTVKVAESKRFYATQNHMEGVHNETYSNQIQEVITTDDERDFLFNSIRNVPEVNEIAKWASANISNTQTFAHQLLAQAAVEGIVFAGNFAGIYWLSEQHIMSGLSQANDFIARDENLHVEHGIEINKIILPDHKATAKEAAQIIDSVVEITSKFIDYSLRISLEEINAKLMRQYLKYTGDSLLIRFGYEPIYNVKQPFIFMDKINYNNKEQFFERVSTGYETSNVNLLSIELLKEYKY